jgi:hypothetical protein
VEKKAKQNENIYIVSDIMLSRKAYAEGQKHVKNDNHKRILMFVKMIFRIESFSISTYMNIKFIDK